MKAVVVIPNYNGIKYLRNCLNSLQNQSTVEFTVLVVDNGSTDGSYELLDEYPNVKSIRFEQNLGFCAAVNAGIKVADTPYVILLNNDTVVKEQFIEKLILAIERDESIFSVSAKMLNMQNPALIDDAGDCYCALGWAFARGKGKDVKHYNQVQEVFSSCGGAAIYRRKVFEQIGYFDELHFAYLEDLDIGYRAKIYGYQNYYEPDAEVLHAGSGFSGSRYNKFKVNLSSANSVYILGKNMPALQIILNLPFLLVGFTIKIFFFILKGLGITYIKGLLRGIRMCFSKEGKENKVRFQKEHFGNYMKIQILLWKNVLLRFIG